MAHSEEVTNVQDDYNSGNRHLYSLNELDDYEVADDNPDIRGWPVKTRDGSVIGKVDDLIVDTTAMKVRYIDLEIDQDVRSDDDNDHALVPIGVARLDDNDDDVYLDQIASIDSLRAYPTGRRGLINRDYEQKIIRYYWRSDPDQNAGSELVRTEEPAVGSDSSFYDQRYFDDQRLYANRRRS